ncbi:MAG: hypothetical protein ACD_3C00086G0059 [uncultured bacterium (gcode 4)]|uniref:Methyltransferase domain-containing protein n=1 Tax=uncultured bacterium (gcode 4) TaxID=1234023 RepID=K2GXQ6_9BACT|nr:MAG: hypothetical protein ACD_3C00086G0059 [uncultured bacterium (gcode 4)]
MTHINKNRETYDILASEYEQKSEVRNEYNKMIIEKVFTKHIEKWKKILDIGCSVGVDINILRENWYIVQGTDISQEMINYSQIRNPSVEHVCWNFLDIEFWKFDWIFAQAFIHLFPEEEVIKILDKMKSILNEDWVAYITTTKSEIPKEWWDEKKDYKWLHKRYRRHWTKAELTEMLERFFSIKEYYEIEDPYGKMFMIFIVVNDKKKY